MKNIAIGLVFSLMLNTFGHAEPYAFEEDSFDLQTQPVQWEPIQIEVSTSLIDLELWILHQSVPAPIPGYLLKKNDWVEIRRILNSYDEEITRVKENERRICDNLLLEKDKSCERLTADLIHKIEEQDKIIIIKDEKIKDLNSSLFWIKTLSGTSVGLLVGLLIYQSVK